LVAPLGPPGRIRVDDLEPTPPQLGQSGRLARARHPGHENPPHAESLERVPGPGGRQSSAASAIDRGAGTFSKLTLPAGTIQVITSTASRPARTAGSSLLTRRAVSGSQVMIEMPRRRSSSW